VSQSIYFLFFFEGVCVSIYVSAVLRCRKGMHQHYAHKQTNAKDTSHKLTSIQHEHINHINIHAKV